MCTASVFRSSNSLLLTANRDELRTRNEAGIKQLNINETHLVYPVDAAANGTWVGGNNHGVAACLLNMYQSNYQGVLSRGLIIPKLLEKENLADVRGWLTSIFRAELYSAFVLLVMDIDELYRYKWDGEELIEEIIEFDQWFLESSSSVSLLPTLEHRQQLFSDWQRENGKANDVMAFHLSRDVNNASQSVCMAREKSHTKSICQVAIDQAGVEFRYLAPEYLESAVNTSNKPAGIQQLSLDPIINTNTLSRACSA